MTVIMAVPGVLHDEGGAPVQSMLQMALAMLPDIRLVLTSPEPRDKVWCERERLIEFGALFVEGEFLDVVADERVGSHVDVVFTPDTAHAREVSKQGVTVALVAASTVVNPRYRPTRKGWGDIVKEYDIEDHLPGG